MKEFYSILLFLLSYVLMGQEITIKGRIVDKGTSMPIAYAGIYYGNNEESIGTTSDENGNFSLFITENLYQKYRVTATGYKDLFIDIPYKQQKLQIEMESQNVQEKKVTTSKNKGRKLVLGAKVDKTDLYVNSVNGFRENEVQASWIDFRKIRGNAVLKKIHIFLSDMGDDQGDFIVRFMELKEKRFETGVYYNYSDFVDITKKTIILNCKKGWNEQEIEPIKLPKKAIAIVISQVDTGKREKWKNKNVGASLAFYKANVQSDIKSVIASNRGLYFSNYEDSPSQSLAIVLEVEY